MERAALVKWLYFFFSILAAVVVADTLSRLLVRGLGLTGSIGFLTGFVIYALTFLFLLHGIGRITGIRFFGVP